MWETSWLSFTPTTLFVLRWLLVHPADHCLCGGLTNIYNAQAHTTCMYGLLRLVRASCSLGSLQLSSKLQCKGTFKLVKSSQLFPLRMRGCLEISWCCFEISSVGQMQEPHGFWVLNFLTLPSKLNTKNWEAWEAWKYKTSNIHFPFGI